MWCYFNLSNNYYLTDPTKFFGCELGAQTQFDFKHDRFIVNGAHDAGKLQVSLYYYHFVETICTIFVIDVLFLGSFGRFYSEICIMSRMW